MKGKVPYKRSFSVIFSSRGGLAGDLTQFGSFQKLQTSIDWLNILPHKHKIVVAGNHDLHLDPAFRNPNPEQRGTIEWGNIRYLQDDSIDLKCAGGRTVRVFGNPWIIRHGNWAFQYPHSVDVWRNTIPPNTDILVTHTPPRGHLDLKYSGCAFLLDELWRLKSKPRLHVFGHVHEGYGQEWVMFDGLQKAYEDVMRGQRGFWALWRVVLQFLKVRTWPGKGGPTLMVNAAMVGGLRDEVKRVAVTVQL
ncbi:hypothetical protein H2199_008566 [Coniosporium tulheliwenetii]|uniref:Uncharacterized protein n=1 Tax=Coniosporium tulheliwenetii TaxID=3383036 RepID=A0ACC2YIB2_9PEZI|nr:hypothetical protein H2199_008566 [Cladosporium sp. JES 115]